jgi:ribulose-bisphosphate carboxylase large chain
MERGDSTAALATIEYANWDSRDGLVSLLNVVSGEPQNLALLEGIRLEQVEFPDLEADAFPGPVFGADWFFRDQSSPHLVCAPIKPSAGLLAAEAASLAYEVAIGGAVVVKDDELSFTTRRVPGSARSNAVVDHVRRAEQEVGEHRIYIANSITSIGNVVPHARELVSLGVDAILVAPALQGIDVIEQLRASGITCPIVIHGLFQTNASRSPRFGVSLAVWALLQRMAGADAMVVPSSFGSFGFPPNEIESVVASASSRSPLQAPASLVMHSGSISIVNASDVLSLQDGFGCALTSGSAIFNHPSGPCAGAAALRKHIDPDWDPPHISDADLSEWTTQAEHAATSWNWNR